MKVTFISNACAIYESQGYRLLSDPWLSESCFDGSWFHNPPIKSKPQDFLDVDALYISHIHPDHCDQETLKYFRRDIPILTLSDRYEFCAKHLRKMGFIRVNALADAQPMSAGPFKFTMFGPFTKHPFHASECELGNLVDSALLIEADGQKVLNCNDNTMSIDAAANFRRIYGRPNLAQLNSNAAGAYPACFSNLSHDEKLAERDKILDRQTSHMADVSKALEAKVVQPFAGQYKLGGGREHLNQYLAVWDDMKIAEYIESRGVRSLVLREGQTFDLSVRRSLNGSL